MSRYSRAKMERIKLPQSAIDEFLKVALQNVGPNGIVETLAYFIGESDDDENCKVTKVLFPNQLGTVSKVDDEGKTLF